MLRSRSSISLGSVGRHDDDVGLEPDDRLERRVRHPPILAFFFASGGWSQKLVTPTIRSPSPRLNRISVVAGEREMMRTGSDDSPAKVAVLLTAVPL